MGVEHDRTSVVAVIRVDVVLEANCKVALELAAIESAKRKIQKFR